MYAFGALTEGLPAAVSTVQLAFDPSPLAFVGLLALAVLVGSALGIAMRHQRAEARTTRHVSEAVARPACC